METTNQKTERGQAKEHHVLKGEIWFDDSPAAEIEHLREQLAAEHNARRHLAADFDNYRRRTRREISQAGEEGKRELLERFISIADDLDLALASVLESSDALAEGLRMIHKRFRGILEANNVAAFESEGDMFDQERHEAFDVIAGTENEPGTVHEEIRRGYFWNGKLLRPALVIVAE